MSWASTSWLVAANFGVDESLDDEGFHTWNCNLGSLHQQPNKNNGSLVQGNLGSPSYLDVSSSSIIYSKENAWNGETKAMGRTLEDSYVCKLLGTQLIEREESPYDVPNEWREVGWMVANPMGKDAFEGCFVC